MKLFSRILTLLLAGILLPALAVFPAQADGIGDAATYNWSPSSGGTGYSDSHYGIVTATRLTVRSQPSTRASSLGTIKNGQPVKILGTSADDEFFMVDLQSCGIPSVEPGAAGYVKASLVRRDPVFLATTKTTSLYATPWTQALKNGEQSNRFFLVLEQSNNWYAVQTLESSAGTSFIRSRDVGQYSPSYPGLYVVTWDAPVFDESTWAQTRTAKRFTPASLVSSSGDNVLMVFNPGTGNEYRGWISAQYIAPLVN